MHKSEIVGTLTLCCSVVTANVMYIIMALYKIVTPCCLAHSFFLPTTGVTLRYYVRSIGETCGRMDERPSLQGLGRFWPAAQAVGKRDGQRYFSDRTSTLGSLGNLPSSTLRRGPFIRSVLLFPCKKSSTVFNGLNMEESWGIL